MGISITGGVKVPQGKFKVYVAPPPSGGKELWAWGWDANGQLGQETLNVSKSSPVQIGSDTTWSKANTGWRHSMAIKTDGTLWAWGGNAYGQLAQLDVIERSSPVQIGDLADWSSIDAGNRQSHAIKTDGSLWSWGGNLRGQLGLGDFVYRSSPVQVGSLTNWASVGTGQNHSFAIKTDGTLWAWGWNNFGELGDGTKSERRSPVQIGALSDWASVGAGETHTFAIKTDGSLWAWGQNQKGKLGLGDYGIKRSSPVQVGGLTNWSSVGSGGGSGTHSLAIKTDGTIWTWGFSAAGRLGDNQIIVDRSSPVQIGSLSNWASGENAAAHSTAIKTDGSLWSWGTGGVGRLGQGDIINRSSPVQIGSNTTWTSISSFNHSLALKTTT